MAQSDVLPEPFDVYRCQGCEQLLTFDARTRVPNEQLSACQSRCDWLLLSCAGIPVPALSPSQTGRDQT